MSYASRESWDSAPSVKSILHSDDRFHCYVMNFVALHVLVYLSKIKKSLKTRY